MLYIYTYVYTYVYTYIYIHATRTSLRAMFEQVPRKIRERPAKVHGACCGVPHVPGKRRWRGRMMVNAFIQRCCKPAFASERWLLRLQAELQQPRQRLHTAHAANKRVRRWSRRNVVGKVQRGRERAREKKRERVREGEREGGREGGRERERERERETEGDRARDRQRERERERGAGVRISLAGRLSL